MTQLEQLKQYQQDHLEVQEFLDKIEGKLTESVMLPLSKLAFIPGELYKTNQVIVSMGDNWFVEQSSKNAKQLIERRKKALEEQIQTELLMEEFNGKKTCLNERNEDGDEFFEIKEQIQEVQQVHHQKIEPPNNQPTELIEPKSSMDDFDKKLLNFIDELIEKEENENEPKTPFLVAKPEQHKKDNQRKVNFSNLLISEPSKNKSPAKLQSILSKNTKKYHEENEIPPVKGKNITKTIKADKTKHQILQKRVIENNFDSSSSSDEEIETEMIGNEIFIAYHRKRQQLLSAGLIGSDEEQLDSLSEDDFDLNFMINGEYLEQDEDDVELSRQQLEQLKMEIQSKHFDY